MILIDDRAGSKEIYPFMPPGRSMLTRLEFGDCCFLGNGPQGSLQVGIEVKTLSDLLDCITTGRFAGHQLPGMARSYDALYLLVLGEYRACPETGFLQVRPNVGKPQEGQQGAWKSHMALASFQAFIGWRNTMQVGSSKPLFILDQYPYRNKGDYHQAAEVILGLESWWSKPWRGHSSLKVFRRELPGPVAMDASQDGQEGQQPEHKAGYKERHSLRRLWAAALPNMGWRRSAAAEGYFSSALELAMADEKQWQQVEGVGKVTARRIVEGVTEGGL